MIMGKGYAEKCGPETPPMLQSLFPSLTRCDSGGLCIFANRCMISVGTTTDLDERHISYILGARMLRVKDIATEVLYRAEQYTELYPEGF